MANMYVCTTLGTWYDKQHAVLDCIDVLISGIQINYLI